jgi:hypothetical protein
MCGRIVVEVIAESIAMSTSFSTAQVEQLRRNAKRLGRTLSISHSEALDRIAAQHGFKNWSLLSKHSTPASAPAGATQDAPPTAPKPSEARAALDPRKRYYLHGDRYEDDPSRYYCAHCDVFFDAAHFASHGPHAGERYLSSLARWAKRGWRSKMDWRRPDDAANLLHESAIAARAQYQALSPAFSEWLQLQRKRTRAGERRDNVGFMALELITSRGLPKTPKSLPLLREHCQRRGAQHYAQEALEKAWGEFLAHRAPNP